MNTVTTNQINAMKPKLPEEVTLSPGDTVTWSQFKRKMASDFNQRYAKGKQKFTPELVESFAIICLTGADFDDDAPKEYYEANEEICRLLEKSKEYENMTEEPIETLVEGNESVAEPEAVIDPSVAQEQPREVNTKEIAIVTKASEVGTKLTMGEVKLKLEEIFDLGSDGNQLRSKPGVVVQESDFGMALAYGAKLEQSGAWLCGDAINMLNALGYENAVIQIASSIGKSASTVYNYAHTAKLIQNEMRQAVPMTVYSEIVNRRYSDDEEENKQAITELANQAVAEKWSCNEARSFADMKQGKEPKPKKEKYRYLVTLPGLPPYLTMTQPGFSEGVQVIDLKTLEYLKDDGQKVDFVPIIKEPTDEQIREMQGV